jgi:hypothetical protein
MMGKWTGRRGALLLFHWKSKLARRYGPKKKWNGIYFDSKRARWYLSLRTYVDVG